jgi:hypothetical protein
MVEKSEEAVSMDKVREVFNSYCRGEDTMEGKQFAKICKDTKLLDKALTTTDVDLIFAKVKDKGGRRIDFNAFGKALEAVGAKKKKDLNEICAIVCKSRGPILAGTKAEANKFHDDKSLYTGVHAQGGPSTVDRDNVHDISQTLDRSSADVRGTNHNLGEIQAVTHKIAGVHLEEEKKSSKPKVAKKATA